MLEIKIREQVVEIPDEDSYESEGGKPVIKLAKLEFLADQFKESVPVPEMLYAFVDQENRLAVAFQCSGPNQEGRICYAVGEASAVNLDGEIAEAFPTIMASNRCRVRWITQALGLSGKVYSDIEFAKPAEPKQLDEITMKSLVINFGRKFPGKTLGELMCSEEGIDYLGWLANTYQPKNIQQKMLSESAGVLFDLVTSVAPEYN
jgi:hypothetical protein